ncbi:MAG: HAD family hydrolase [Verrucomicrobiales bacterium]
MIETPNLPAPAIRAVGLDLDGTLFDRAGAFRRLMAAWLGEAEAGAAMAEIERRDGAGHAPRELFFGWLADAFPSLGAGGDALWQRFQREFPAAIEPDPFAAFVVGQWRKRGVPVGILTNGSAAFQRAKLAAAGLGQVVGDTPFLASGSLGCAKPDPRAFAALSRALGVPAAEILFAGDDWQVDVCGALAAGMQACWVATAGGPDAGAAAAARIDCLRVRHVSEIAALF